MKLKALAILILVSTSAFAESPLSDAQSLRLLRALSPYPQIQQGNAPVVIDPSGRGRVLWKVSFQAEIAIQDSCMMNATYFQETSESIITLIPGQGYPTPTQQSLVVKNFEVKGIALSQPSMCNRMSIPMRRSVALSVTFSKEDQLLRPPPAMPPSPPAMPSALFQYVSVAGQIFQIRLQPAPMGQAATVQMIPIGPPPTL